MTDPATPRLDDAERSRLRARLEASRATLLAALEGVTERDFTTNLGDGMTVVRLLAGLVALLAVYVATTFFGHLGDQANAEVLMARRPSPCSPSIRVRSTPCLPI